MGLRLSRRLRPWGLAALWVAASPATAAEPARGQPIIEIRYEAHDVFDLDKPGESAPPFRFANAVHARTKQAVIKRELLFSVGDRYDPELLRETERNLRRMPFIRKAEVSASAAPAGAVVVVRTWDSWTMEVIAKFKRAGGVNDTKFGFADRNLFGYGKTASLVYSGSGGSADRTFSYKDRQLFGSRLESELSAGEGSQSRHYAFSLGRPFYASITKNSLIASGGYAEDRLTIYDRSVPAGVVGQRSYGATLVYGYALEASPRRTRRLTAGLSRRRADYSHAPGETAAFIPEVSEHTFLQIGAEYRDNEFIKQRRIQKLSRDEDFNLGWVALPSLSFAPRWQALGSSGEELAPRLTLAKGFSSELGQFVILRAEYSSTYVNGGNGSRVATFDAQYFCRYFPRHTVASHVAFDHGYRLGPGSPLTLGEDNGLRGYRAGQFRGNRRFLFNAEDRIFLFEDLWKLLDAGGVFFFDTGYVWGAEEAFRPADLKSSVGFGLRLGATRSASNDPVRIDVARALNDNRLPTRWTLSIQAGHSFGPQ